MISFSDEELRDLAREILSEPGYARWREEPSPLAQGWQNLVEWVKGLPDRLPHWLTDAWQRFSTWLGDLFRPLGEDGGAAGWERWAGLLALAALTALLVVLGVSLRRVLLDHTRIADPGEARTQRSLLAEADALAHGSHFLEAAHRLQLAALQLLLERRWIALERSDPNRTLRSRLRDSPLPEAERSAFLGLLDQLESRWFRDRGEDQALYSAWRDLHERLTRLGVASAVGTP